jgi:hypothetical protein
MRIKVDLEHTDAGRCTDFGCRVVTSENSHIERISGDQALQKGTTEAAGLCKSEVVRGWLLDEKSDLRRLQQCPYKP